MNKWQVLLTALGITATFGATIIVPVEGQLSSETEIESAQDAYFAQHGKYVQVQKDSKLPEYEKEGTVKDKLGKDLPKDLVIHVYESPEGKGYQIIYPDGSSHGYGPEARNRTWDAHPLEVPTGPSTTPE